ncbi:TPA: hemolytic protein HlpA-like protein [Candidatus Edwardsbacteria bacterium]|nr:hemolytic protein HlpA-like protein [Candidatus Edwardsbacteria bacterium]
MANLIIRDLMNNKPNDTPVLLLGFNRPEETGRVLERLRENRVQRLFLAVDGPREGVVQDAEKVARVRQYAQAADWGCAVETLFNEKNMGLKKSVSRAIGWFFSRVESGIILEDDCLPSPDFFVFCRDLLERYREDPRVMTISGNNFHYSRPKSRTSYHFSKYPLIWGWATWKRAWDRFDFSMSRWPSLRDSRWLDGLLGNRRHVRYWERIFDQTHREQNHSWAYRWTYSSWLNGGLTAIPSANLVSNIGFSREATHTRKRIRVANAQAEPLDFPLIHPETILVDDEMDQAIQQKHFSLSLYQKIRHRLYMMNVIKEF